LIVFVVLGVGLGWFAYKWREAERQRKVVEAIERVGGEIYYDIQVDGDEIITWTKEPPTPAWLRGLADDHFFCDIAGVDLNYCTEAGDVHLEHIKGLTGLNVLFLSGTRVTDVGMKPVKGMPNLECLDLNSTRVTDAGLVHLRTLKRLKRLCIADTQVTDAGLEAIKGLTELGYLDLHETNVTEEGIEGLQKALPNCEILTY